MKKNNPSLEQLDRLFDPHFLPPAQKLESGVNRFKTPDGKEVDLTVKDDTVKVDSEAKLVEA